ncbi:uncharacterized protein TNCT_568581 [Trichonephila clavata]|uniref:DUF5641 domain-containing protein n=1 Tax=Trichonephila clavata TaxID=2740835 RepID=A0A8X6L2X4_TRICU|nr:uncharacterized protein TNCT_568581 [Trichonephila clavata]
MVLIGDDNKKRLSWPIAKIIELIPGRDGEIRTVRLKTQHGTVIRPVQRIFPLEVQAIANNAKELKEESNSVQCTKPENDLNTNDVIVKKYTSSGRLIKEPKRLDLLNYKLKVYYNMALTEDSRPFTILRKKAEYFRSLFDENIKVCQTNLDSQISDLLRDPDSFGASFGNAKALNAHMEFSKAKYEIFVNMQSLFDEMEANWIECIADMKASFLENVEIFLAGTKLEVKLPSSETLSAIANKRSPLKKSGGKLGSVSSSPASSLYPILSSAKKQISRLSSLFPGNEDKDSSDDSEDSPKGE